MYIDSIKGGALALVVFGVLSYFIHGSGTTENIKIILTVTTFIFAILIGFFISRSASRFNEIRKRVGYEDALFLSLFKCSQIVSKTFSKKVCTVLSEYYQISYDYNLTNYPYKKTLPIFLKLWDAVRILKTNSQVYGPLIDILTALETNRNTTHAMSKEKVNFGQWILLLILSLIILFCFYYIKSGDLYSMVITSMLSTALVIVLLLLRDLQNLNFGGGSNFLEESGQEVLESMGLLRYYNKKYLDKKSIPKHVTEYRLGEHKPGEKPIITIVKRVKI